MALGHFAAALAQGAIIYVWPTPSGKLVAGVTHELVEPVCDVALNLWWNGKFDYENLIDFYQNLDGLKLGVTVLGGLAVSKLSEVCIAASFRPHAHTESGELQHQQASSILPDLISAGAGVVGTWVAGEVYDAMRGHHYPEE